MAREIQITPFEEYLRLIGETESSVDATLVENNDSVGSVETEPEFAVDSSGSAEQLQELESPELLADELDVVENDSYEPDVLAELSDSSASGSDLDALFQELLKTSVQAVQAQQEPDSVEAQPFSANPDESNRVAQLEQVVQNLTKVVQQTVTALHAQAQMTMAEQEARALKEVTRQLQADGIFFTDEQLRDIMRNAQEQGIPYSVAVKAAAWDAQRLYRAPLSTRPMTETPFQYPFLAQSEPSPRRAERTDLSPNRVRSFSEYLEEVERALSENAPY